MAQKQHFLGKNAVFRQKNSKSLAVMGGGGVPPFAVIKKSVKNLPKSSVFRQKRRFWRKNSKPIAVMGGGVPPFAVIFFPLFFWLAACR